MTGWQYIIARNIIRYDNDRERYKKQRQYYREQQREVFWAAHPGLNIAKNIFLIILLILAFIGLQAGY